MPRIARDAPSPADDDSSRCAEDVIGDGDRRPPLSQVTWPHLAHDCSRSSLIAEIGRRGGYHAPLVDPSIGHHAAVYQVWSSRERARYPVTLRTMPAAHRPGSCQKHAALRTMQKQSSNTRRVHIPASMPAYHAPEPIPQSMLAACTARIAGHTSPLRIILG
jgi:hypothetical protein